MATATCGNANCLSPVYFDGCDSCYECVHKPQCDASEIELMHIRDGTSKSKSRGGTGRAHSPNNASGSGIGSGGNSNSNEVVVNDTDGDGVRNYSGPAICVICEEKADQKCIQCRDLYCSRTWMGNPGCFLKMHDRGNRMTHTTEVCIYFYF